MALNYTLLVLGWTLVAIALVLLLRPQWHKRQPKWLVAAIPAFVALLTLHASTFTTFPRWTLIFYGVATIIVVAIAFLSPKGEPDGRNTGNLYLGLGAIAGGLVGMIAGARYMMLGVVLGCLFGELAFGRTPHGSWLKFPSLDFIHYFCARGLQAIVATAMIGIAIEGFVFQHN